jgi:hypothetical protein
MLVYDNFCEDEKLWGITEYGVYCCVQFVRWVLGARALKI